MEGKKWQILFVWLDSFCCCWSQSQSNYSDNEYLQSRKKEYEKSGLMFSMAY